MALTIKEAAAQLAVVDLTIRRAIRAGKLPAHLEQGKHGARWSGAEGFGNETPTLWQYNITATGCAADLDTAASLPS